MAAAVSTLESAAAASTTIVMRTLLVSAPLTGGEVVVDGDEAHHGRAVLRLRVGERVRLADGAGRAGVGEVAAIGRHELRVAVAEVETLADDPAALLTVAVAAPKGERFDALVRGLTELGVGRILPLACARGERQPANLDRQRRIAAEALKQCRRGRLPQLGPLVDIATLAASPEPLIMLDRAGTAPCIGEPRPTTLVIGPEGGLDPAEVAILAAAGAVRARLAGSVLRIETAALAAAAVWVAAWENHPRG
jgi:16S rRNA (uracil1498-N3)-methyltransferase